MHASEHNPGDCYRPDRPRETEMQRRGELVVSFGPYEGGIDEYTARY